MSEANKTQVGGAHYQTPIQHWDFAAANQFDYFQGVITKYITRWKKKGGVQDLEKAQHYLQKYIEVIKAGTLSGGKQEGVDPRVTLTAEAMKEYEESITEAMKQRKPGGLRPEGRPLANPAVTVHFWNDGIVCGLADDMNAALNTIDASAVTCPACREVLGGLYPRKENA